MKKSIFRLISTLLISLVTCVMFSIASAQDAPQLPSPVPTLESISSEMAEALTKYHVTKNTPPSTMAKIAREVLLPHADVPYMAKLVIGRTAWNKATKQEQEDFIPVFTRLMINTYAATIASYKSQKFLPIHGEITTPMTVNSIITRTDDDAPEVKVQYQLTYRENKWLVYDFVGEGISMIHSFKSQFTDKLNNMPLSQLTQELKEHNAKNSQ